MQITYPPFLPVIDLAWLRRSNENVRSLAEAIREKKDWVSLPVLADALEEAGCRDEVILRHLRGQQPCPQCQAEADTLPRFPCWRCAGTGWAALHHSNGCWLGQCWLINHLLGLAQPVFAKILNPGCDATDAIALNPGEWFGMTCVLYDEGNYYVVEADNDGDALDVLIESGNPAVNWHLLRADGPDAGDYGWACHPGDIIGGLTITQKGYVNLRGEFTLKPVTEAQMTGNGVLYDGEHLFWSDPDGVRYFGPGLPAEGMIPAGYAAKQDCRGCGRNYFPQSLQRQDNSSWIGDYCSRACFLKLHGYEVARRCAVCDRLVGPWTFAGYAKYPDSLVDEHLDADDGYGFAREKPSSMVDELFLCKGSGRVGTPVVL